MNGKPFLDTNILVYAIGGDARRSAIAAGIMGQGGKVSVHVLNEFANVASRKLRLTWQQIETAIDEVLRLCPDPVVIDLALHKAARRVAERFGYSLFDAMVIASASRAGCRVLLSEDMQHGQTIDGRLTIRNPFLATDA